MRSIGQFTLHLFLIIQPPDWAVAQNPTRTSAVSEVP